MHGEVRYGSAGFWNARDMRVAWSLQASGRRIGCGIETSIYDSDNNTQLHNPGDDNASHAKFCAIRCHELGHQNFDLVVSGNDLPAGACWCWDSCDEFEPDSNFEQYTITTMERSAWRHEITCEVAEFGDPFQGFTQTLDATCQCRSACRACMPGEYKGLPGRHNCTRCESGKYSAALGATECHACRKNSMTPLGSQNAEDCACKPGFELLNTTVPPSDAIVWVLEDAGDGLTGGSSPGKSCDEICAAEDMQCDGPTLAGPIRARDLAEILVRAQWSESYGFTPTCTPTTPYFARQSGLALFGHWAPEPGAESSCPDSVTPTCSATHNSSGEIQRLCPCYRPATTLTCEPCALGYFKNVSGNHRCQQCPRGSFSNETGSTHCTECPDKNMHTMQRASRNISQCMCNAGYTGPNGKACTACEPGQYKELPGPHGCFLCGRNTYSPDPAATTSPSASTARRCPCRPRAATPRATACAFLALKAATLTTGGETAQHAARARSRA